MANLRKVFSKIYDENVRKIYRFIFLKVNSKDIAKDLTSQTFLRGWEAFKRKQNPRAKNQERGIKNPPAFLYQIARNLVIDYYREKGKTEIISAEFTNIIDPRPDPEETMLLQSDFNRDLNRVREALANLKDEYQDVVIWYYLDGFSISKIAKISDKNEGAIRVMIHRALKKLRQELEE